MSDFEKKLARDLSRQKEYREAYAEAFANEYVATQIQLQRKQRGWTQEELGRRIGSNQGRISVYEDDEYGKWSLDTLRKLAGEFGLWLKVSFEAYSTLVYDVSHFAPANLVRPAFDQDPAIHRWLEEKPAAAGEVKARLMVERWAAAPERDLSLLAKWLQGFALPGFNDREWTPAQYLLDAIPDGETQAWAKIAEGLAAILETDGGELAGLLRNPAVFWDNLFGLARSIGPRRRLQDALDAAYKRSMRRFEKTGESGLGYEGETGLLNAMIHNQADERWKAVWYGYLGGRDHPEDFDAPGHPCLPGNWLSGVRGLLGLPRGEGYWREIARGIGELERRFLQHGKSGVDAEPNVLDEVERAVAVVFDWWGEARAAQELLRACFDLMAEGAPGWFMHAQAAWAYGVHQREGWEEAVRSGTDMQQRMFANSLAAGLQWYEDWRAARMEAARTPVSLGEAIRNNSARVIQFRQAA